MTTQPSATPATATPTIIGGKYRLDAELGEGGMGVVWRAFNLQLEVPVAIKLLHPDLSPELGDRLRTEARAAGRLMHPSIVRVFDVGESEAGEPFIVMELLHGQSLGELIDLGPLSATRSVRLLLPIIDALVQAHARGVVHRDLKPDNIFIAREGDTTCPKLLDFGIAKLLSDLPQGKSKLTQAGTLLGSPDYMSPEQARGVTDIDQRTDIWSLCVVLYEALSGKAPFAAENCPALLRCIIEDAPAPLAASGVDAKLAALVERGLAKDRAQRYGSMLELGQALAAWLLEQGVREDITGVSVSSKWLRTSPRPTLPTQRMVQAKTRSEQGTLASVVHASDRPSALPASPGPGKPWRSLALAAVAMLALVGGGLAARASTTETASGPFVAPAWESPVAAAAQPVPSAATPKSNTRPEPAGAEQARGSEASAVSEASAAKASSAPKLATARSVRAPQQARKMASALEQPASVPQPDLLDPYL